jgi:DNA replication protein DnaC
MRQKGNVLSLGPPGVGKTHLAIALGVKACMVKYRVLFIKAQHLLENLDFDNTNMTPFGVF